MSLFLLMKLDEVYKANLKNEIYKDVVVYKKKEKYIDLKSKEVYELDQIENLIPLSRMLGFSIDIAYHKILPLYFSMIHQEVPVDRLYIGDIGVICNKKDEKVGEFDINFIKKNHIFLKTNDGYYDIEEYFNYHDFYIGVGDLIVVNLKKLTDIKDIELKGSRIDKQKIIRMYRNI